MKKKFKVQGCACKDSSPILTQEEKDNQIAAAIITYMNLHAEKFNLKIDWGKTDINKRILEFTGDADDQQIENFCRFLVENFDEIAE